MKNSKYQKQQHKLQDTQKPSIKIKKRRRISISETEFEYFKNPQIDEFWLDLYKMT